MGPALWRHRAWIACTLDWQGRRRAVMTGRRWTELFFHDEAVALAAGHRPCAYCRRSDWLRWRAAWARAHGAAKAPEMDAMLHAARAVPGARRLRRDAAGAADLPDGTFVDVDGPALVHGGALRPWRPGGYAPPRLLPRGRVAVLTNPVTRAVIAAGYRPVVALPGA
ncbi:hypothetical protein JQC91_07840 [Jannaschia sp. Os4]|uniref:hypothetical protein n=1 Tax=Jannaschia sp. Os4 TaxID=2807617 RepID=UPI00193AAA82|nr:hypothetical protein [Jannaschia sp. Os4]MBM2576214.1 hypothetical protein [Jannaschia sp. Os4]